MLLDKLTWVQHEGAIYSVHAQPKGPRFATGGFDQKVKVWNLSAALDAKVEAQPTSSKLLATLVEHTGAVNVVRFSHDGKLLASGSDDQAVIVYHLLAGVGGLLLGSAATNVENWRPKVLLRGHTSNVSDLAWSHDDTKLATASMDGKVMVWEMHNGHRLATLTAQSSFVKGVQWDPVGSYLAAQSDDHTVVVYSTSDWAPVAVINKPYRKMITDTFATRLSFSPEGAFLLTGNTFQRGNHCAVVVPREQWANAKEYLFLAGHTGAVVSTAFNPMMFHSPLQGRPSNGKGAGFSEDLTSVFATGCTDRRVVVWRAGHERPLFAGKAFFKQGVTDLAWTSDGYTLLACSTDGTVGVFQFSEGELGRACSGEEMEEVMQGRYGSRQRGAGGGLMFAESVDQLEEEPQQQQQQQQQEQEQQVQPRHMVATQQAEGPSEALGPSNRPAPAPAPVHLTKPQVATNALARLEGRMGAGGDTQVGFGGAAPQGGAGAALPAPVRPGDSRKRIAPEPTGSGPAQAAEKAGSMPPPGPRAPAAAAVAPSGGAAPAAKRQRQTSPPAAAAGGAVGAAAARATGGHQAVAAAQPTGAAAAGGAAGMQPGVAVGAWGAVQLLQAPAVRQEWTVRFRGEEQQQAALCRDGEGGVPPPGSRELRIANRDRGLAGRPQAELSCTRGRDTLWSDVAMGQVVSACGTPNFAAVGMQDGSVMLYSPAGRRLGGPLKLGAGLARLACDGGWLLLAITTSGRVKLVHVGEQRTLLSTTLAPLLEDGSQLVDARLSRQGWPILTLSSHRAYLWHPGMEEWMCVAEEAYSGAPYIPTIRLQSQGELAGLQAAVLSGSQAAQPRALLADRAAQQQQSRALLEGNLAAALCLRSPQEYRRWLGVYAQLLAELRDEGRLRELCMEFMGPPFAPAAEGPGPGAAAGAQGERNGDAPMAMASALAAAATPAGGREGGGGSGPGAGPGVGWEPRLLGLDKREELLRGEVLRVVGRSRAMGPLAQEMKDMLDDLWHMG